MRFYLLLLGALILPSCISKKEPIWMKIKQPDVCYIDYYQSSMSSVGGEVFLVDDGSRSSSKYFFYEHKVGKITIDKIELSSKEDFIKNRSIAWNLLYCLKEVKNSPKVSLGVYFHKLTPENQHNKYHPKNSIRIDSVINFLEKNIPPRKVK